MSLHPAKSAKITQLVIDDHLRSADRFAYSFASASNCINRSRSGSISLSGIMLGPSEGALSGS
jgi:hypothetical protein